ncbi:hypothetical protein JCM10003_1985 [Bacteroides pyogenes JCM 10003]|nr:hypothetical protein JCM10003_1985 [Bacteroides pyogenes JCM 10003]
MMEYFPGKEVGATTVLFPEQGGHFCPMLKLCKVNRCTPVFGSTFFPFCRG